MAEFRPTFTLEKDIDKFKIKSIALTLTLLSKIWQIQKRRVSLDPHFMEWNVANHSTVALEWNKTNKKSQSSAQHNP